MGGGTQGGHVNGTTESKLRSLNPVLQRSETYISVEGETQSSVAESQNLTLSLLLPG
jgi:hypothetical protein